MRIHFMGIGGSGMASAAAIAKAYGYEISGCDLKTRGHDVKHLENIDLLAVSPAVFYQNNNHPEVLEAKKRGILMTWQEFMGKYLHSDKFVICVAGTHGKSTTTTMVGKLLIDAGLDPTVEVGAIIPEWGGGDRIGKSKYFVSEADEFYSNFLHYHPDIVILNNIELDHPEYFGTFDKMLDTYAQFISQIKPGGTLIYNMDNPGNRLLISKIQSSKIAIVGYSLSDYPKKLKLSVPGNHNKANAMGVIKLCELLKLPKTIYEKSLGNFSGIDRRLQELGTVNGVTVIDDYANLPTAFQSNIKALREKYSGKPIWVVIEPHTFSRLRAVLPDLAAALKDADHVIISKIFASREVDPGDFTGADIAAAIPKALYIPEFSDIIQSLISNLPARIATQSVAGGQSPAIILVMGSGNSDKLAREILENL